MEVEESSSIVLPDGSPRLPPAARSAIGWVRDGRVGLHLARPPRGFQVDQPFFDLLAGCHVGAHGMTLYDGASPAETRVAAARFRPRRHRAFERTWTQQIALDATHESGPAAHLLGHRRADHLAEAHLRASGARTPAQASEYSPNSSRITPQTSPMRGALLQRGAHRLEQVARRPPQASRSSSSRSSHRPPGRGRP